MNRRAIRQKRNNWRLLVAISLTVLVCSSCNENVVYNKSADVHQQEWTPADTLFFDFRVEEEKPSSAFNSLCANRNYMLRLNTRFSKDYPFMEFPLHLVVEKKSYSISPKLHRTSSWGSLYQDNFTINNINVSFPDTGLHSIAIFPDTILNGVFSVGIELVDENP